MLFLTRVFSTSSFFLAPPISSRTISTPSKFFVATAALGREFPSSSILGAWLSACCTQGFPYFDQFLLFLGNETLFILKWFWNSVGVVLISEQVLRLLLMNSTEVEGSGPYTDRRVAAEIRTAPSRKYSRNFLVYGPVLEIVLSTAMESRGLWKCS